jgi:hypothetical protein
VHFWFGHRPHEANTTRILFKGERSLLEAIPGIEMILQSLELPLRNDDGVLGNLTTDAGGSAKLWNIV